MPEQSTVIKILIASPSDLQHERNRIPILFNKWNSAHKSIHLAPIMWESESVPELGDHPQHSLNRRLIPDSELLIAMFWSKIGTPTPTAASGSIEEIREFISLKGPKRVMLYFCDRHLDTPPSQIDYTAIALLQEFKKEMRQQGLYESFVTHDELESKLYHNLDIKVDELLRGLLPMPLNPAKSSTKESPSWCRKDHPDKRLHIPIVFGDGFSEMASAISSRVAKCIELSGATNENYLEYGSHIFQSAGYALNEVLDKRPYDVPVAARLALRSAAQRLIAHGENSGDYLSKPWGAYYLEGSGITDEVLRLSHSQNI